MTLKQIILEAIEKNKEVLDRLKRHDEGETIDTSKVEEAIKIKE